MGRLRLSDSVWALVIILCSAFLQCALLTEGHNWGGDFSAYIMQAISLVDGTTDECMRRNAFAMQASSEAVGPVAYPWGFPLLLAPVYALMGVDFFAFKLLQVVLYQLFLWVLWFGLADRLTKVERVAVLAIFAFNPFMLRYANHVLSDIPFLLFSTMALLGVDRIARGRVMNYATPLGVLIGLMMASAYLMRSNGVMLLPVFVLACWISGRQYRTLLAGLLGFALPVWLLSRVLPDAQASYVDQAGAISVSSVWQNLLYYATLMQDFFAPSSGLRRLGLVVYLMTLPFVCVGVYKHWRGSWVFLLYAVLTLALFVAWPFQQGLRFLFPVLPVYMFYGVLGSRDVLARFAYARWPVAVLPLFALVLLFASVSLVLSARSLYQGRPTPEGPFTPLALQMFDFVSTQTADSDVIIFRKPRVMRLMTDRDALMYRVPQDIQHGEYLVIDKRNQGDQLDVASMPESERAALLSLVFSNEQFEVYGLNRLP